MSSMGPLLLTDEGAWEKKCRPPAASTELAMYCGNSTRSTRFFMAYRKQTKQYFFFLTHHMTEGNLWSFRAVRQACPHTWLGSPLHHVDFKYLSLISARAKALGGGNVRASTLSLYWQGRMRAQGHMLLDPQREWERPPTMRFNTRKLF